MLMRWTPAAAIVASTVLLGACTSNEPPKLQAATSGPAMQQQDIGGRPSLAYIAPGANFKKYKRFIIDPVVVYRGSDADFGDATEADKQQMAGYMHSVFASALGDRYKIVTTPGPDVLRIHLTLAGLEDSTPVVSTVSHVVPAGLVMNFFNSSSGKPGSFSAGITIAGEFRDSQTNALQASFVQKRFPDAMDVSDTLTSRDGQRAAIEETAKTFRARVDKVQMGGSVTE